MNKLYNILEDNKYYEKEKMQSRGDQKYLDGGFRAFKQYLLNLLERVTSEKKLKEVRELDMRLFRGAFQAEGTAGMNNLRWAPA